jgi:hypothetical protein
LLDKPLTSPPGIIIFSGCLWEVVCDLPLGKRRQLCSQPLNCDARCGECANQSAVLGLLDLELGTVESDLVDFLRCPNIDVCFFIPVARDMDGVAFDFGRANEVRALNEYYNYLLVDEYHL